MSSRILAVAIDCHDADALAAFWCDVLGYRITKRCAACSVTEWRRSHNGRTVCDLPHKLDAKGGDVEIAIVLGLVVLIFAAAAATVAWEDRRAARQAAAGRAARLARLGEVDPLAHRFHPPH